MLSLFVHKHSCSSESCLFVLFEVLHCVNCRADSYDEEWG